MSNPVVDQYQAAVADVERRWPLNADLVEDPQMERGILRILAEPWQGESNGVPGWPYLVVHATRVAEPLPGNENVEQIAQAAVPWGTEVDCDRCDALTPIRGVVLMTAPPLILAIVLCTVCVSELDNAHVTGPPEEEN